MKTVRSSNPCVGTTPVPSGGLRTFHKEGGFQSQSCFSDSQYNQPKFLIFPMKLVNLLEVGNKNNLYVHHVHAAVFKIFGFKTLGPNPYFVICLYNMYLMDLVFVFTCMVKKYSCCSVPVSVYDFDKFCYPSFHGC